MKYETIKNWRFPEVEQTYTELDTILYALGVGYGSDPMDEGQLRFVIEDGLRAAPTMPVVLAHMGFWQQNPETGIDWRKIVAGETALELHKPLPVAGTVVSRARVTGIADKGAAKGAVVYLAREISDKATGELLATIRTGTFCRGDGGLEQSDPAPPPPPEMPAGAPDLACELRTVPQQALIYRLSGDRNPLHSTPSAAKGVGFERPILHGLATYGLLGHAVVRTLCDYDPSRLASISARFSSPVFPGDTIRTDMWKRGDEVFCRATAVERNVVVLNNGVVRVKAA
ncbi:MaoC/PaaZ C-terminal domain-containing protein [Ramlibacter sp.]|uniref:MaoC/PaaZ C-terminal domain-containing protein n=1 Tax=Ramlibacter sp. TaxID=1917967 RepID=UPI003D099FB3